jgi:hypothetical protein
MVVPAFAQNQLVKIWWYIDVLLCVGRYNLGTVAGALVLDWH